MNAINYSKISTEGGMSIGDDYLLDYGDGDDVIESFNKEYSQYGFWARNISDDDYDYNDGAPSKKGYRLTRKPGEGAIRIYYRDPRNGPVYNQDKGMYTHDEGAWIDVLHDSWNAGTVGDTGLFRRSLNHNHIIAFLKKHYDEDYWEGEDQFIIDGDGERREDLYSEEEDY